MVVFCSGLFRLLPLVPSLSLLKVSFLAFRSVMVCDYDLLTTVCLPLNAACIALRHHRPRPIPLRRDCVIALPSGCGNNANAALVGKSEFWGRAKRGNEKGSGKTCSRRPSAFHAPCFLSFLSTAGSIDDPTRFARESSETLVILFATRLH